MKSISKLLRTAYNQSVSLAGTASDRREIVDVVRSIVNKVGLDFSIEQRQLIVKTVVDEIADLGPITDLILDRNVADVVIERYNLIRWNGRRHSASFAHPESMRVWLLKFLKLHGFSSLKRRAEFRVKTDSGEFAVTYIPPKEKGYRLALKRISSFDHRT